MVANDHILILEDAETIGSVLHKVDNLRTSRAAIVAPGSDSPLHNPVSVRLLQRRARDRAMTLSVISDDEFTRWLCRQAGLRTYSTLDAFRGGVWSPPNRLAALLRSFPLNKWVSGAAGAGILAVLIVVLSLVLPSATVVLAPAASTLTIDVPVIADSEQNNLDVNSGRISARLLTAELDGQRTVTATGQRDSPDASAKGVVTFTSSGTETISVPKGTVVMAGPVSFSTTQDAEVPSALRTGDVALPGSANVPVQAVNPGKEGNVRAGAITAIAGSLHDKLTVLNSEPTSGGSVKKVSYLSADDQEQAKQALRRELTQQAMNRIHAQLARNLTFVPNPQSQGDGAIEQLSFEQTPEQVTSQTVLHMRVLVKGLTFEGDDVNSVVDHAMRAAVARSGSHLTLTDDALKIDPPVIVTDDGSAIKLQVRASGRVVPPIDSARIIDAVRGMTGQQARGYLRKLPGIADARIDLWPPWAGRVPRFSWRIRVRQAGIQN